MANYVCVLCGYRYRAEKGDIENGIEAGTDFEDISEDWVCPLCGASKDDFELVDDNDLDDEDWSTVAIVKEKPLSQKR